MSSDPKGPETIPLTAEADEHEGHYAWEVEPFDPEGPVGIVISMADVECGQPLDATLVVLADSDDDTVHGRAGRPRCSTRWSRGFAVSPETRHNLSRRNYCARMGSCGLILVSGGVRASPRTPPLR